MNNNLITSNMEHTILNTFKYYKRGSSVPSDGNCGLHAICKALFEGVRMTNSKIKPDSLMVNIFCIFDLEKLPDYWWSDEELAVIANYFGYDMYIYNETDRTGIVFGKGIRPPLVLYSVENNSHWIPGKKTIIPSSRIPKNFTVIENISEVLSIKQIKKKINGHLLMMSLNLSRDCINIYSGWHNKCCGVSSGKHVKSISRRHNGSRSELRDDGNSQFGRGNRNFYDQNEESMVLSCIPLFNNNHSRSTVKQKQKMSPYAKLKKTMLSKMINQMCHWNNQKIENNDNKLVLFDSEDKSVVIKSTDLNAIYNARFMIVREILLNYLSKYELTLLEKEVSEFLAEMQPSKPSVVQFEKDKYPQLEPTETECPPVMAVNCYSTEAIDCDLSTSVDSCSNESTDCFSNVAAVCGPDVAIDSSYVKSDSPCDFIECPFFGPQYTWVTDNCDKNMGVGWLNRVYNKMVTMSNGVIERCLFKQKIIVKAPPAVVVTPAMSASVVAVAAVASPIMVTWVVEDPELGLPVIQEASAIAAPTMVVTQDMTPPAKVAAEVAAPTMVALPDKDLVAVLVNNNHTTVSLKENLAVASADNNSSVKPKARVRRYFSLKKNLAEKM